MKGFDEIYEPIERLEWTAVSHLNILVKQNRCKHAT